MKCEFSNEDTLYDWLAGVVKATKYDLYYVPVERRLLAIKNVSTEPRLHGFADNVDIDAAHEVGDSLDRPVTNLKSFEWDHSSTEPTTE